MAPTKTENGTTKMTTSASMTNWTEAVVEKATSDPSQPQIKRVTMEVSCEGDLVGHIVSTFIMVPWADNKENVDFHGTEVFEGKVNNLEGRFVCTLHGTYKDGVVDAHLTVMPETCAGQLKGMKGSGGYKVAREKKYEMTFEFEAPDACSEKNKA